MTPKGHGPCLVDFINLNLSILTLIRPNLWKCCFHSNAFLIADCG